MDAETLIRQRKCDKIVLPETALAAIKGRKVSRGQYSKCPRSTKMWDRIQRRLLTNRKLIPLSGITLYDFLLLVKSTRWLPTINDIGQMAKTCGIDLDGSPDEPALCIMTPIKGWESPG